VLRYVPGHFQVDRHVRPACSCRKCEAMKQAPMPDLPIPRGMVNASFLTFIVISKFCDHIPLYRLAGICARRGLDIDRSQLAEWLGHVAWLLAPLVELIAGHVSAGRVIHCDDTPVPASRRPPCSIATLRIAKASIAARNLAVSPARCTPTAIRASTSSTRSPTRSCHRGLHAWLKSAAGATSDAASSTTTRHANRRSPRITLVATCV